MRATEEQASPVDASPSHPCYEPNTYVAWECPAERDPIVKITRRRNFPYLAYKSYIVTGSN
jgi:hypothetical protein